MRIVDQSKPTSILTYFLILSLLLHFFFLMSASLVWVNPPVVAEKSPSMEVPAYFYRDEAKSGAAAEKKEAAVKTEQTAPTVSKHAEVVPEKKADAKPKTSSQQAVTVPPTDEEPIHLVGDKHTPPKPLAKIIGRALTKKLVYPKVAADFRVHGTVYVGFSLHPDGTLTGIKVVESSRAGILDEAALQAVSAITPLQNVGAYVSKTRYLVIGIIFR